MLPNFKLVALCVVSTAAIAVSALPVQEFQDSSDDFVQEFHDSSDEPFQDWTVVYHVSSNPEDSYDFEVSGPDHDGLPSFSAYCSGNAEDHKLQPCKVNSSDVNLNIAAHVLEPEVGPDAHIEIKISYLPQDLDENHFTYNEDASDPTDSNGALSESFIVVPWPNSDI